ncbi:MAG: hypothetical protein EXR21_05545 [Flavobacteriaceae bacterium]|nr:hypothetical protein [Flavobacteriaceae bacterium]
MKLIIELIILGFIIRWVSQLFRIQQVHIHNYASTETPKQESIIISGSHETKKTDLGNYVVYEELKD